MKKSFMVTLGLVIMICTSLAFTDNDDGIYKNLKVLPKDITEKQMDSVMHHYTASLSVKCNFCHVRREGEAHPDFASDDNKHKLIARDMMRMTDQINDKYFDYTGAKRDLNTPLMVTCYSCHHGAKNPATKPPVQERQQKPLTDSTNKSQ